MEDVILFDPELYNEIAIDTCVENVFGSVLKALAASTSMRRPRDETRSPILGGIQDELRLKTRLRRQWHPQGSRPEGRDQPPAGVGDPPSQRVEGTISGGRHANPLIPKTIRFGG